MKDDGVAIWLFGVICGSIFVGILCLGYWREEMKSLKAEAVTHGYTTWVIDPETKKDKFEWKKP